jgi:hypothetical protein
VCYPWTAAKAARAVADRLWGVHQAYMKKGVNVGYINHIVISVPESEYDDFDLKKQKKKMRKYAKGIGLSGGCVLFHPWRLKGVVEDCFHELRQVGLKGGDWAQVHRNVLKDQSGIHLGIEFTDMSDYIEFGPHWHIVGYFRIKEKSDDFERRTGWTYINVTMKFHRPPLDKDGIRGTVSYLATHHCVFPGKQSITYFGCASPNKVHCDVKVHMEFAKCPDCYVKHDILDLSGSVIDTRERGVLYKIPVKSGDGIPRKSRVKLNPNKRFQSQSPVFLKNLQSDIACRVFKFNPSLYEKAFDYRVSRCYTVIVPKPREPRGSDEPKEKYRSYSWCNGRKYYLLSCKKTVAQ